MKLFLLISAYANSPDPFIAGFHTPSRDDAPRDGVLLVDAGDVTLTATLVLPNGATQPLMTEVVHTAIYGNPAVAVLPPDGGWPLDQLLSVRVAAEETEETRAIAFRATDSLAVMPASLGASEVQIEVGPWTEKTDYAWGCCLHTRRITLTVGGGGSDVWAGVDLVGVWAYSYPTQIEEDPIVQRVDLMTGPEPSTLVVQQWMDDEEGLQPPCFRLVSRSAAGERDAGLLLCADEVGDLPVEEEATGDPSPGTPGSSDRSNTDAAAGCSPSASGATASCSAAGGVQLGGSAALLAGLLLARRRRLRS